jgi:F-type H+-transporting ATPase subunit epsilon
MHLEIITPEKSVLNEEVDELLVPTATGQIGILPHHISLVTQITAGEMVIRNKGKERFYAITGGFLEVNKDKITILADYAEHAEQIDTTKAQQAQKRAEEVLSKKREILTKEEIITLEAELRRALLQQHIAQRQKHRR